MKKEVFYLHDQCDPHLVETTGALIIWTICLGADVLAMPELNLLINQFYSEN
jgi:hypothetical protein